MKCKIQIIDRSDEKFHALVAWHTYLNNDVAYLYVDSIISQETEDYIKQLEGEQKVPQGKELVR